MRPLEDGRLLLGGESAEANAWNFSLMVLDSRGELDASFGADGRVVTSNSLFGPNVSSGTITALALQPDGKVVAAGEISESTGQADSRHIGVARYLPDGSLDTTFGNAGTAILRIGKLDTPSAIRIESDGGVTILGGTENCALVARLTSEGRLDGRFASGGIAKAPFDPGASCQIPAAASQSMTYTAGKGIFQVGGGMLFAGTRQDASPLQMAVIRLLDDGSPDSGFGRAGLAGLSTARDSGGFAVSQRSAGDIVVGGVSGSYGALGEFRSDGRVRTEMGTNGLWLADPAQGESLFFDIVGEGEATYAMGSRGISPSKILVARDPASVPMTTFGANGYVEVTFPPYQNAFVMSGAIDRDGEVLAAGTASDDCGSSMFAVIRVLTDGTLDTKFGQAGRFSGDFKGVTPQK